MFEGYTGPVNCFQINRPDKFIKDLVNRGFAEVLPSKSGVAKIHGVKLTMVDHNKTRIFFKVVCGILVDLYEVSAGRFPLVRKIGFLTRNGKDELVVKTKSLETLIEKYTASFTHELRSLYRETRGVKEQKRALNRFMSKREYWLFENAMAELLSSVKPLMDYQNMHIIDGGNFYDINLGRSRDEAIVLMDFFRSVRTCEGLSSWRDHKRNSVRLGRKPEPIEKIKQLKDLVEKLKDLARNLRDGPGLLDHATSNELRSMFTFGPYVIHYDMAEDLVKNNRPKTAWAKETANELLNGSRITAKAVDKKLQILKKEK